jgi:hypothetical protein
MKSNFTKNWSVEVEHSTLTQCSLTWESLDPVHLRKSQLFSWHCFQKGEMHVGICNYYLQDVNIDLPMVQINSPFIHSFIHCNMIWCDRVVLRNLGECVNLCVIYFLISRNVAGFDTVNVWNKNFCHCVNIFISAIKWQ